MNALRKSTPPPSVEALTTLRVDRGHVSASRWQNITIIVWVGQATATAVKGLQQVNREMVTRFPGGHSSISFILDGLPAPTPEAAELLTRAFAKRSELVVNAVVLEGSGFWASGLRGMLNNSHREAGSDAALKIMTGIEPLVSWFSEEHAERTNVSIAPMQLRDVLMRARKEGERLARGET